MKTNYFAITLSIIAILIVPYSIADGWSWWLIAFIPLFALLIWWNVWMIKDHKRMVFARCMGERLERYDGGKE